MTLELSLAEVDVVAARIAQLAYRLQSMLLVHQRALALDPGVAAAVRRQADECDRLATDVRVVAQRYHAGEGAIAHALTGIVASAGRAFVPTFTAALVAVTQTVQGLGLIAAGTPSQSGQRSQSSQRSQNSQGDPGEQSAGRVAVTSSSLGTCVPATGFASALERVPGGDSQVRIERVGERYFVYIGGTRDFALHPTSEPWDMASNLQALAGVATADSEEAVREAMRQAGVESGSPVVLVGHSQGGLIADRIAASGDYFVTDVITAGAPAHLVDVSPTVRLTAFEHSDDVIPALSGVVLAGSTALFVREKAPMSLSHAKLPAHDLAGYVATASSADRSSDPVLRARKAELVSTPKATCTATEFEAKRSSKPDGR